jgi:hypothetical protein
MPLQEKSFHVAAKGSMAVDYVEGHAFYWRP